MEELLNKLIEKGREPFGNYRDIITRYKYDERFFEFNHEGDNMVSIRELVSKESGLWQFVCENKLIEPDHMKEYNGYGYWLCESALCNEEDLEKFLLENIKIS